METKHGSPYYLDITAVDGRKYYSYSIDALLSPHEVKSPGFDLFDHATSHERIKITKKAWKLAMIRDFPDSEKKANEILKYSNGEQVTLSFYENVVLFLTRS